MTENRLTTFTLPSKETTFIVLIYFEPINFTQRSAGEPTPPLTKKLIHLKTIMACNAGLDPSFRWGDEFLSWASLSGADGFTIQEMIKQPRRSIHFRHSRQASGCLRELEG